MTGDISGKTVTDMTNTCMSEVRGDCGHEYDKGGGTLREKKRDTYV